MIHKSATDNVVSRALQALFRQEDPHADVSFDTRGVYQDHGMPLPGLTAVQWVWMLTIKYATEHRFAKAMLCLNLLYMTSPTARKGVQYLEGVIDAADLDRGLK